MLRNYPPTLRAEIVSEIMGHWAPESLPPATPLEPMRGWFSTYVRPAGATNGSWLPKSQVWWTAVGLCSLLGGWGVAGASPVWAQGSCTVCSLAKTTPGQKIFPIAVDCAPQVKRCRPWTLRLLPQLVPRIYVLTEERERERSTQPGPGAYR